MKENAVAVPMISFKFTVKLGSYREDKFDNLSYDEPCTQPTDTSLVKKNSTFKLSTPRLVKQTPDPEEILK